MERREGTAPVTVSTGGMRRTKLSVRARRAAATLALGVLCILSTAPASLAQQADIDALASRVAKEIAKARKKKETKVAVADFVAVNGKSVPLGTWLADQFSVALAKAGPGLEIIERAKVKAALQAQPPAKNPLGPDANETRILCDSGGADILVKGTLGPAEKAVGITLTSFDCSHPKKVLVGSIRAKISLNPEMEALLPGPPDSLLLPGDIWLAGQGGAGEPSCIQCPAPQFPEEAVRRNRTGMVVMEITVTRDGRAADIKVLKAAGEGFDEKAIEAVRGWKFKPALGPDGTPVPVRTPVEVTFWYP